MTKKKKILLIVLPIIAVFLILFTPIPRTEDLPDGNVTTLNSLTYKLIFWNLYKNTNKPYNETELILPPDNFCSVESLFEERQMNLWEAGYGAYSITVTVDKIDEDNRIWIKEISNDKNALNNVVIGFDDIEKYGKNINKDDIKENTLLKISYDGRILTIYPGILSRIYSIELVDTKKNETVSSDNVSIDNNSETPTNTASQEVISSNNTTTSNIESIQTESSVPENTPSVDSSIVSSSTEDDFLPFFWSQTIHKYDNHYDNISGIDIPYLVVEPHNYDPNQKYPVILFLHGAGYRFNSPNDSDYNELQVSTLVSSYIFSYEWLNKAIIVAPQISTKDWWDFGQNANGPLDAAMRIFDKVTSEYSCDNSRYYVTGGSMGGYATWQVASKYNDVFAAAMPMCGWWTPSDAPRLLDMPIRIIHGTADSTVSVERSKLMYNAIKSNGGQKVVLSLYKDAEHDVWRQAYYDKETWEWLFSQKKT